MIPLHSIRRWRPPFDKKRRPHPMPPISTTHAPQISIYRSIHRTRVITEYIKINRNTVDIWKYVPLKDVVRNRKISDFVWVSYYPNPRPHPMPPMSTMRAPQISIYRSIHRTRVITEYIKINRNTVDIWKYVPFIIRTGLRALLASERWSIWFFR